MLNISLTTVICSENLSLQNINVRSGQAQFAILWELSYRSIGRTPQFFWNTQKSSGFQRQFISLIYTPVKKLIIMNITNTAIKYSLW